MSLYNAKQTPQGYRITKFNEDLEVESSYITSREGCDCPAGSRDTCRHREMLPAFIEFERVGTWWFLDYDRRRWVDPFKKAWRRL